MDGVEFTSKQDIYQHFQQIAQGDEKAFAETLRKFSASKLKDATKLLGLHVAADKADTIKIIVDAVKQEDGMAAGKKDKKVVKAATEAKEPKDKVVSDVIEEITTGPEDNPGLTLKVNKRYFSMIPRPSKADKTRTLLSIKEAFESGGTLSEKIRVLSDMTIYDGHTRIECLKTLGIPVTQDLIEIVDLTDEEACLEIYKLNIARRQLSDVEKIKAIRPYLPQIKKEVKAAQKAVATERMEAKRKAAAEGKLIKLTEKKPSKAEKEKTQTHLAIAKATGVSPANVKLTQWCEKWAPEYLDKEAAAGKDIGTIYGVVHDTWYNTVQKFSPDLLAKVKAKEISLEDAYAQAVSDEPETQHVPGPLETAMTKTKEKYLKVLTKKYGGDPTPDEHEADFMGYLDGQISKYFEKNV